MSADEDTELRDLVAQTLEANGVLGKIRAQLRANVFLALEEQESVQNKTPFLNQELTKFLSTKEGRTSISLVREFLEYFNLEFSISTLEPECGFVDYEDRETLARDLNVIESTGSKKCPLLCEMLKRIPTESAGRKRPSLTEVSQDFVKVPKDLTPKQVADARQKFEHYDQDKSGTIDKDELRSLFQDIFPGFHRNMLERYVTDEFRAVDTDYNSVIDFDEFLGMYKRLFILCKSVVSHDVSDIVPSSPKSGSAPSKIPAPVKKTGSGDSLKLPLEHKKSSENVKVGANGTKDFSDNEEDDPFFDDPVPNNHNRAKNLPSRVNKEGPPNNKVSQIPVFSPSSNRMADNNKSAPNTAKNSQQTKTGGGSTGLTSLQGLPSLTDNKPGTSLKDAPPLLGLSKDTRPSELDNDLKAIDKKIADLGFDIPDDDYEDDFLSSGRSETLSGRSDKSKSQSHSIAEEIDEDIHEDISIENDELTTDRTISYRDNLSADYIEDILSF